MLTVNESKKPAPLQTFHMSPSVEMNTFHVETEGGHELEDLPFAPGSGSDLAKLQTDQEVLPAFQHEPSTWEAPTTQSA